MLAPVAETRCMASEASSARTGEAGGTAGRAQHPESVQWEGAPTDYLETPRLQPRLRSIQPRSGCDTRDVGLCEWPVQMMPH